MERLGRAEPREVNFLQQITTKGYINKYGLSANAMPQLNPETVKGVLAFYQIE